MKRVRITRATVAARRPVMVGEVLDLPDPEAALLVAMKKATEIPTAPEAETQTAAEAGAAEDQGQAGETPRPSLPLITENAGGLVRKIKRKIQKPLNPEP